MPFFCQRYCLDHLHPWKFISLGNLPYFNNSKKFNNRPSPWQSNVLKLFDLSKHATAAITDEALYTTLHHPIYSKRIFLPEVHSGPSFLVSYRDSLVGKTLSTLLLYRDGESRGQSMSGARWNKAVHKGGRVRAAVAAAAVAVEAVDRLPVVEGERKEGRLSLASGNLQLQGYRAVTDVPFAFSPSSLFPFVGLPSLFRGMQKLEKRSHVFHEFFFLYLPRDLKFLCLNFCLTLTNNDLKRFKKVPRVSRVWSSL